jgi:hypothetical protein
MTSEAAARADWEQRIYQRLTDTADADPALALPAPARVTAEAAVGHVVLDWTPVPGAAGYLIERVDGDGAARLVQHGGSDVAAVVAPPFADTGLADGVEYHYRVGAVAGADQPAWAWSDPVSAGTWPGQADDVAVQVDAGAVTGRLNRLWHMVGSERLTQLTFGDDGHGNDIGTEFAEALRRAHDDLGATHVRAHAILHDDNAVVTEDGYSFERIDALYDRILALGVRPVVELSFMPAALMADQVVPETTWGTRSFGLADERLVQVQQKYATEQLQLPVWGMSPSSTADDTGQYGGFGVEGLTFPAHQGLSQCTTCATETTVTPHASIIALDVAPQAAYANIQALLTPLPRRVQRRRRILRRGEPNHRNNRPPTARTGPVDDHGSPRQRPEQRSTTARLRTRPGLVGGAHLPVDGNHVTAVTGCPAGKQPLPYPPSTVQPAKILPHGTNQHASPENLRKQMQCHVGGVTDPVSWRQ